jgi:Xaa-Pro aminopeptidase
MLKYLIIVKLIFMYAFAQAQLPDQEFAARRQKLMNAMPGNSIIIIKGSGLVPRNGDVDYKFRQNSNFYYLSGFDEPDAALILLPESKKFVMFIEERSPFMAIFVGDSYTPEQTKKIFKADTVISMDLFNESLKQFLSRKDSIYIPENDEKLTATINKTIKSDSVEYPAKIKDIAPYLAEMRLIKSDYEITMMQKAIDITGQALDAAMKETRPDLMEYKIDALISYTYTKNRSPRVGFPSIIASGPNSTTLHYEKNNDLMEDGELLLMDIGAEYGMYSADVTRTIPVNGTFSEKQKDIYQIVLDAEKAGIEACNTGTGIKEVHNISTEIIKKGLLKLGLITDVTKRWQTHVWFMHSTSHWLGMETHDVGSTNYRDEKGRVLKPGMVLTVEPGIYIAGNALNDLPILYGKRVDKEEIEAFINAVKPAFEKYKNIGIRIEDDVLVTNEGYRVLSGKIVREINDIEKMMAEN